jgi:3-hydroxybutyryl-CoA dehydratase
VTGLCWEDFSVGQVFESGRRTVTEADVVAFAELSGDRNPLHLDEEFARGTPFKRRIAHGLLGLSIASGLGEQEGILSGTIVAFLGMEWAFKAPIFIGDTIRQRRVVVEKREVEQKDRGLLRWSVQVLNQDDRVVQEGVRTLLVRRKT